MDLWIKTIICVVFINIFSELLLKNSRVNEFVKNIISIASVIMIILPIINIEENFLDKYMINGDYINEEYIENFNKKQKVLLENELKTALFNNGFFNIDVDFEWNLSNNDLCLQKVKLDLKNLVINSNDKHINRYNQIKEIVKNVTGLQEEQIELNGG